MPPGPKESWSTPAIKLSLLCQFKDHFWVKPGSFSPPPKVDSGVFSFFRKEPQNILVSPFDDPQKYAEFSRFLATAFSKKRKMLRGIFPALKNEPIGAQRAEELSPDEIFALSRKLGRRE